MQVFKDDHQWAVQRLAKENPLERLERAPPSDPRVHISQWIVALDEAKKPEQVGQRVFQLAIKGENFAVYLLAPRARVIFGCDAKIGVQQVNYGLKSEGLVVRNRESLQDHPAALVLHLELVEQARFAYSRLSDYADDLAVPCLRQLRQTSNRIHLGVTAHESGQAAAGR